MTEIKEAESNIRQYLRDGLLKKETNETAKQMYIENSELSLQTANKLLKLENNEYKPHLWIIVTAYYSMFYIANAVLLSIGYKVGDKISHKVTNDALTVFVRNKLKRGMLKEYETTKAEALELISSKTEDIITSFALELRKRSKFQYQMDEKITKGKALTSLQRAKEFRLAMQKLL